MVKMVKMIKMIKVVKMVKMVKMGLPVAKIWGSSWSRWVEDSPSHQDPRAVEHPGNRDVGPSGKVCSIL